MKFTPHPYQQLGIEFLLRTERAALWADMGMGKTVATLTTLDLLRLVGEDWPTLIVAPKKVALNTWPGEVVKWDHLKDFTIQPVIGTAAQRLAALARPACAYTINYENLPWLFEHVTDWPFATVVADESTRLKSMRPSVQRRTKKDGTLGEEFVRADGAKRARQLARIAHTRVRRWINLTGTPSPNGLADLWGQTWFQDAGARLGRTYEAFFRRWFRSKEDGYGAEPLPFADAQIHDRLRDVCLSLRAEDWFDVRKPLEHTIYVDLPAPARKLYRDMEREMFMKLEGTEVEAFNAAARTMKCLQLANGAAYKDEAGNWAEVHTEKLEALESIYNEAAGAPLLVAYHFKSDLVRLLKRFPQGRKLDDNPKTIADWNAGRIPILFAHPQSAGHGLNLQDGGHILVYFSVNWNLEYHAQIAERIGPVRQLQAGHNRVVRHYYILARGTVDMLVMQRLESKREVQDILMEAMAQRRAA